MESIKLQILTLARKLIVGHHQDFVCLAIHQVCCQITTYPTLTSCEEKHVTDIFKELTVEVQEFLDKRSTVEDWLLTGNTSEVDNDTIMHGEVAFTYRLAIIDVLIARHSQEAAGASAVAIIQGNS